MVVGLPGCSESWALEKDSCLIYYYKMWLFLKNFMCKSLPKSMSGLLFPMFYNFVRLKNGCKAKDTKFLGVCVQIIGEPPAMICRKNSHLGGEKLIAMP